MVFVLPTLSCRAAWRWVPFEKTHHQHRTGQQGSSGWKHSLITTFCIAVLMAITISHRKSSSWSHHWYLQNSGIVKIFQGSQSLWCNCVVRRLSLNYTWTMQTSAEGGILWKLCSCTLYRVDTARILPLEALGKTWGILGGNDGASSLSFSIATTFIIKTCSWWQNEQKLGFDFYLCLLIVEEIFPSLLCAMKDKRMRTASIYEWCETCLSVWC